MMLVLKIAPDYYLRVHTLVDFGTIFRVAVAIRTSVRGEKVTSKSMIKLLVTGTHT